MRLPTWSLTLTCLFAASTAHAVPLGYGQDGPALGTGDRVTITRGSFGKSGEPGYNGTYGSTAGGVFQMSRSDNAGTAGVNEAWDWHTFCLEQNETISLGGSYYVNLNQQIEFGQPNGSGVADPLTTQTRLLFLAFVEGVGPAGLTAAEGTDAFADAFQRAIWKSVDIYTPDDSVPGYNTDSQAKALVAWANAIADGTDTSDLARSLLKLTGGVYVANLYDSMSFDYQGKPVFSGSRQSMLWFDEKFEENNFVPEPASLALAFLGAGTLVMRRRRRRS